MLRIVAFNSSVNQQSICSVVRPASRSAITPQASEPASTNGVEPPQLTPVGSSSGCWRSGWRCRWWWGGRRWARRRARWAAADDRGAEPRARPGEAPSAVGQVVGRTKSRVSISSSANTARSPRLPVSITPRSWSQKKSAVPLRHAVDGLLDTDGGLVAGPVREHVHVASPRRRTCEVRAGVGAADERVRVVERGFDPLVHLELVVLRSRTASFAVARPDAVREHPVGQRVRRVQAALLGEVLQRDALRARCRSRSRRGSACAAAPCGRRSARRAGGPSRGAPVPAIRRRRGDRACARRGR